MNFFTNLFKPKTEADERIEGLKKAQEMRGIVPDDEFVDLDAKYSVIKEDPKEINFSPETKSKLVMLRERISSATKRANASVKNYIASEVEKFKVDSKELKDLTLKGVDTLNDKPSLKIAFGVGALAASFATSGASTLATRVVGSAAAWRGLYEMEIKKLEAKGVEITDDLKLKATRKAFLMSAAIGLVGTYAVDMARDLVGGMGYLSDMEPKGVAAAQIETPMVAEVVPEKVMEPEVGSFEGKTIEGYNIQPGDNLEKVLSEKAFEGLENVPKEEKLRLIYNAFASEAGKEWLASQGIENINFIAAGQTLDIKGFDTIIKNSLSN